MLNKVPIKINLSRLCENEWFVMATPNAILEWGCAFKITHISAATNHRLLNMVSIKS